MRLAPRSCRHADDHGAGDDVLGHYGPGADDGRFEGSVSGGCGEGAVIERARAVISSGEPELLEFQVSDESAWDVGLACGGRVRIYLERVE